MIQKKLVKAISLTLAGSAFSLAANNSFAAITMYNTWDAGLAPGTYSSTQQTTDGWTYTNGKLQSGTLQPWYGTDDYGGAVPFGYTGHAALNWGVELSGPIDSATISSAESLKYGGPAADVDTGKGAWLDGQGTLVGDPTKDTGWKHAVDFGVIKVSENTTITLTPTTTDGNSANWGISVFDGMDTSSSWSHHGGWHGGYIPGDTSAANLAKAQTVPSGMVGLSFINFSDGSGLGSNGGNSLTFTALKDHVYTVVLGGSDRTVNTWSKAQIGYSLNIAAVPEPEEWAMMMFGLPLIGWVARRKQKVVA